MRLGIVTPEYAGVTAYTGGIGSQYAMMAPELVRQGHEVSVVTYSPDVTRRAEHDGVRFELVAKPRLVTTSPLVLAQRTNGALERLGSPDLVLGCEYGGSAWRYARGPRRAPLITHLHSSTIQIARSSQWLLRQRLLPVTLLARVLERGQARRSDALVAPTRSILAWSRELWGLDGIPADVVPNTVEVGRVRALAEGAPPPGFPSDGPVIAYFGRLETRKGVHVLVEAMKDVWARVPDAQLALMGADNPWRGGSMMDHLRELAGPSERRLHLLGPQPPERLFPALAAADVVALPSLWENFATAALEAMALGSTMVVSSGTGYDEFVRPDLDALMVPRGDPRALAAALVRLIEDGTLRARLAATAAEAAEGFDVPVVAPRMAQALMELSESAR
jgi:glycogen(starch) synthase